MKNSELDGLVEWDITEKQKRFKILTLFGAEPQYHLHLLAIICSKPLCKQGQTEQAAQGHV